MHYENRQTDRVCETIFCLPVYENTHVDFMDHAFAQATSRRARYILSHLMFPGTRYASTAARKIVTWFSQFPPNAKRPSTAQPPLPLLLASLQLSACHA